MRSGVHRIARKFDGDFNSTVLMVWGFCRKLMILHQSNDDPSDYNCNNALKSVTRECALSNHCMPHWVMLWRMITGSIALFPRRSKRQRGHVFCSACSSETAIVWKFWGCTCCCSHFLTPGQSFSSSMANPQLPYLCSIVVITYVASSFANGHCDKASDTSVRDYEKAAYSVPTRCHLCFLYT